MMTIYDLVEKYGKGQGEGKMWASVAVMSDALEPMKETDKEGYWCIGEDLWSVRFGDKNTPVNGWCASHSDFETDNVLKINLDNPSEAIEILRRLVKGK